MHGQDTMTRVTGAIRVMGVIRMIRLMRVTTYLIFVIFLHGQNFWRIKFTLKKLPIFELNL